MNNEWISGYGSDSRIPGKRMDPDDARMFLLALGRHETGIIDAYHFLQQEKEKLYCRIEYRREAYPDITHLVEKYMPLHEYLGIIQQLFGQ